MIPLIGNVLKGQIHTDRKEVRGRELGRNGELGANVYGISFWDNETVLKLIKVTVEKLCEYTRIM